MITRSWLLFAVPLLPMMLVTDAARAEPSEAAVRAGDAEREQARHLYDEAIQYGKRGEYRRAKASLSAAWSLVKSWEIAVNLGSAEIRLGQFRSAAEHLAWGIRDGTAKEGEDYPPIVKAKTLLEEAASRVGQLKLVADEPGAAVFVDEEVVGRTPLADPLYLDPGEHVITARPANPERASLKLEVRVQAGDALERFLRFSQTRTAPPSPSETAEPATDSPAGYRTGGLFEPRTFVPVTLGGLTGISAGVALAFTIKGSAANGAAADWAARTGGNCDAPSAACDALADARERRNEANRIANIAWVGAGMFGVATVATLFFWPKAPPAVAKANLRIAPGPGGDVRGVSVMGMFE